MNNYVTWSELIQFGIFILTFIAVMLDIHNKRK